MYSILTMATCPDALTIFNPYGSSKKRTGALNMMPNVKSW